MKTIGSAYRAFVISGDAKLSAELSASFADFPALQFMKSFPDYPDHQELIRMMRVYVPNIIFLSVASLGHVRDTLAVIRAEAPKTQIIAIHSSCETELLLNVMRLGIVEFLFRPFQSQTSIECAERIAATLSEHPQTLTGTDQVYSFLPAKQGVGTTTVALNTAVACARVTDRPMFLGDFDLNNGQIRFLLNLRTEYSVLDAAERVEDLDENLWPQIVSSVGRLHVAHSGKARPDLRIDPHAARRLLDYLRRAYKAVFLDLSGNLEKYSLELMRESKRIFLVTTPETPALQLAREKEQFLTDLDLGDRISVVLNRWSRRSVLGKDEVAQIIGRPVDFTITNDYRAVHAAVANAAPVAQSGDLGSQFEALARMALNETRPTDRSIRRFIRQFSLVPARFCGDHA